MIEVNDKTTWQNEPMSTLKCREFNHPYLNVGNMHIDMMKQYSHGYTNLWRKCLLSILLQYDI